MKKFIIKTSEFKYPVYFGNFNIKKVVELVKQTAKYDRYFILVDKKVNKFYGDKILKEFNSVGKRNHFLEIHSSEKQKSFPAIQKIYSELSNNSFGRDSCLVAIGGGIVGDLGGFAASTYMRGIKCVHIPTTILSAVDSSIGGKTGYNFKGTKNLIGTFYQPVSVITSTHFFNSLPGKEIDSGIGEIIKCCFLSGKKLYDYVLCNYSLLRSLDEKVMIHVLNECISIKSSVVCQDEKERGLRKILNFGHTFAHAFESYFNFKISHGKAVVAGIIAANILSKKMRIINKNQFEQYQLLPSKVNLPEYLTDFDNERLVEIMKLDKKVRYGKLNFVLVKNFGELVLDIKVNNSQLNLALNELKKTISV